MLVWVCIAVEWPLPWSTGPNKCTPREQSHAMLLTYTSWAWWWPLSLVHPSNRWPFSIILCILEQWNQYHFNWLNAPCHTSYLHAWAFCLSPYGFDSIVVALIACTSLMTCRFHCSLLILLEKGVSCVPQQPGIGMNCLGLWEATFFCQVFFILFLFFSN